MAVESLPETPAVVLDGGSVHIRDLLVAGQLAELVGAALEDGKDAEDAVRHAIDVGAAVLLHGAARGTVDAVAAEVSRLMALLDEKSSRIEAIRGVREQVSSGAGLAFEEAVAPYLDACFGPLGDELEATGSTVGIANEKTGDYVVTLNTRDSGGRDRRIVIECKARKGGLTVAGCLQELDKAMLNRSAHAALMLFSSRAQSPLRGKPLRVYPGNRLLAIFNPEDEVTELTLEVASQLARTLALAAEREDLTLDRARLAEKLDRLTSVIERASAIKRGISTARRGLNAAEDAYVAMTEDATATLLEIEDRL
jgi:hypothetical protein